MLPVKKEETAALALSQERLDFLRRHYAKDATPEEFEHFVDVCRSRGLRPDAKQIYFIKLAGRGSTVLSIDAYRLIAQRTGVYAGILPVQLAYDESGLVSATITVKKIVHGQICEFSGTAIFGEYYKPGRDGKKSLWDTMPATMLEKCAEAKALRKAFPEELSEFYTREEMDGTDTRQGEPVVLTADPKVKAWIHGKLKAANVPESEWEEIVDSLNGYPKNELLLELKRLVDERNQSQLS